MIAIAMNQLIVVKIHERYNLWIPNKMPILVEKKHNGFTAFYWKNFTREVIFNGFTEWKTFFHAQAINKQTCFY